MKRIALTLFCLLCLAAWLPAQNAPVRLAAQSVDPQGDSLALLRFRARLDTVRAQEHRPTVALVLSGGGAKGAAHAGVLKYLEEKQIPVDAVLGTSMGGLVGGLYALGYPASYLDSLLRAQDWGKMLSDRVERRYIPATERRYRDRYLLSVPFNYGGLRERLGESLQSETQMRAQALSRSLPSGFVTGLNVGNLISQVSVGYHANRSFSDLPIPYLCVATDLVSCKAKNWTGGSFPLAMRSTMSIPGLFTPVRYRDMVLTDGGMRNNFPTDLAKAIGADIVIGVDLSQGQRDYSRVNNLLEMTDQMIEMLARDAWEHNQNLPDVFIKPDLHEYNMLSFSTEAIDTILARGYQAARDCAAQLDSVKNLMPEGRTLLAAPVARDIGSRPVTLSGVRFTGVQGRNEDYMIHKLGLQEGDSVDAARIEQAVAKLWASHIFNRVGWSLLEQPDGRYELVFHCSYGPAHQLGVGVRADTEELVSGLVYLGLNAHKLRSSRLSLEGRIGQNRYIQGHYVYFDPDLPTINAEVKVGSTTVNLAERKSLYNLRYFYDRESFYFSGMQLVDWDLRAGVKHENYKPLAWLTSNGRTLGRDLSALQRDYVGVFGYAMAYTLDDYYYPTGGFSASLGYDLSFGNNRAHVLAADFRTVLPRGGSVALIPSLYGRSVFGGDDNIFQYNLVGGSMQGRYIDHQIPFVGMHRSMFFDKHVAVLNLDLRTRLYKDVYLSLQGGAVREGSDFEDLISGPHGLSLGAAGELGYDSVIGPVKASLHWSDIAGWGAYLSVGFDF